MDLSNTNKKFGSQVSIDNNFNLKNEFHLNNRLNINDPGNNNQQKCTGILNIQAFNIFLVFNFDEEGVFAFDIQQVQ